MFFIGLKSTFANPGPRNVLRPTLPCWAQGIKLLGSPVWDNTLLTESIKQGSVNDAELIQPAMNLETSQPACETVPVTLGKTHSVPSREWPQSTTVNG